MCRREDVRHRNRLCYDVSAQLPGQGASLRRQALHGRTAESDAGTIVVTGRMETGVRDASLDVRASGGKRGAGLTSLYRSTRIPHGRGFFEPELLLVLLGAGGVSLRVYRADNRRVRSAQHSERS